MLYPCYQSDGWHQLFLTRTNVTITHFYTPSSSLHLLVSPVTRPALLILVYDGLFSVRSLFRGVCGESVLCWSGWFPRWGGGRALGGSFKSPWVTKGVETAVCTLRGGGIKIRKPAEVEDPDQNIPSTLQTWEMECGLCVKYFALFRSVCAALTHCDCHFFFFFYRHQASSSKYKSSVSAIVT